MRILRLAAVLLFAAIAANAQTLYVDQFAGKTISDKMTAAQNACQAGLQCDLVIRPELAQYTEGTLPNPCSSCVWFDYRTGALTFTRLNSLVYSKTPVASGSAGISIFHTGAAEWLFKTDAGNGTIFRIGRGGGDGTITSEFLRFGAGIYFGNSLAYFPMTVPAPETTTEAAFRLLGGANHASSMEIYSNVAIDDPILLPNFERVRLASGTSAGIPANEHALISEAAGTGTVRPIAVIVGANQRALFGTFNTDVTSQLSFSGSLNVLHVTDTSAVAAHVGGGITLRGTYTGTTQTEAAAIAADKDNAVDGDFGFGLGFYTRANGSGSWTPGKAGSALFLGSDQSVTVSGGTNTVFRCATAGALPAGALTITAGSCGTTADTGLRVK